MRKEEYTFVIVPGYADSGSNHWQGIWLEHFPNSIKIIQKDWINVDRDDWVRTLDAVLQSIMHPVILVGHSLGCSTILFWANSSEGKNSLHKIKGALLVAPPDPHSEAYRALSIKGFDPLPLQRLPFPTILVTSANDPFLSVEKACYFADCLGSELVNIGEKGHIGEDSGVGEWKEGKELLKKLTV